MMKSNSSFDETILILSLHSDVFGTFFTELQDDTDSELVITFVFDMDKKGIINLIPVFFGELPLNFLILFLSSISFAKLHFIIIRISILQLFYTQSLCPTLSHHRLYLKALTLLLCVASLLPSQFFHYDIF